jgi:hypothetical protein
MWKRTLLAAGFALAILVFASLPARVTGASGTGTRLLRTPTVSATQIAFAYANNLWIVERAGGVARRLTSFAGQTTPGQSIIVTVTPSSSNAFSSIVMIGEVPLDSVQFGTRLPTSSRCRYRPTPHRMSIC